MPQILRKIAGYEADFTHQDKALLINIIHPNKAQMLFNRVTDYSFPQNLKDLSDNTLDLFEVIKDLADDKIVISPSNQLVLLIVLGKKTKEFSIQLERAQISNEETLKKRVEQLQKMLEKKQFQAEFYKDQFSFLLKQLQLKPNIQELQQLYEREDVAEILYEGGKESKLTKNSSVVSNRSKVGASQSNIKKQEFKCPKMHDLVTRPTPHLSFLCNVCRQSIPFGENRLRCDPCDFDVCKKCSNIPPQNRKYCPENHGLIFGAANNYLLRQCDKCNKKLMVEKGYSCVRCDYDVCEECL